MISEFVEYVKQVWKNKPNVSSPLNADRLNHMESGIENNSKKIKETVTAVNENTEKTDAALAIVGKPDEYSTSKTYAVGDKCIYENALYKCTTAISAAEAWTAGHWTKTSLCAEDAANKAAIKELTENIGRLHFSQINYTTDQFGQISTIIPNSKIISAWCNKPRSFVTPVLEQGTGLCVYTTTNTSLTADNIKPLANTNVDVNVLYYDF